MSPTMTFSNYLTLLLIGGKITDALYPSLMNVTILLPRISSPVEEIAGTLVQRESVRISRRSFFGEFLEILGKKWNRNSARSKVHLLRELTTMTFSIFRTYPGISVKQTKDMNKLRLTFCKRLKFIEFLVLLGSEVRRSVVSDNCQ